jgi:hypothetical protein
MTRRPRPLAALLAVFALLFAQLAVSAHACEPRESPVRGEVTADQEACHEMAPADQAPATDNVCFEHCQYGDASVDNSPPAPAAVDSSGPVLRLAQVVPAAASLRPAWRLAPAAAPPPPAILFGVLRI